MIVKKNLSIGSFFSVANPPPAVIARRAAMRQSHHPACHCEERSDAAISILHNLPNTFPVATGRRTAVWEMGM
jgi:hypothetical protein